MAISLRRRRSSLTASGAIPTPKGLDQEMGSSRGLQLPDQVPALISRQQALQTYNKMVKTDTVTSVSLRAGKVPVLGSDFYLEPGGDDQEHLDQAEFVDYNLFSNQSTPWLMILGKVLRMYQDGFSTLELVFENGQWAPRRSGANAKTYTMLKKLGYRPALTIGDILLDDNGGPVEIVHSAIQKDGKLKEVHIPIEKAIVFTMGDGDTLFGDSLCRSAYQHWYYKTHLYKIDGIQKERHAIGVPKGILPPGYKDTDKQALIQMLRNLRTNELAEIALPPGYDINFAKVEGQLVDVLKSASYHDTLIMLNIMAEFMMLGIEAGGGSGSRGSSGAQLDIFYKSEWYIANMICAAFNMFLIPKLIQYNFDTDVFPQLKVRNIGQSKDLQQLATALANVVDKELITPDMDLEQWTRNLFDAPRKTEKRPEFSPSQVRKIINESTINNNGASGVGNNGNDSTVGAGIKGGFQGKSVTQP